MNPQLVRSTGQGLGERVAPINKAQVKLSSNSPFKPSSPPDPKSLIRALDQHFVPVTSSHICTASKFALQLL